MVKEKVRTDLGGGGITPTELRVQPISWATMSLIFGAAIFAFVFAVVLLSSAVAKIDGFPGTRGEHLDGLWASLKFHFLGGSLAAEMAVQEYWDSLAAAGAVWKLYARLGLAGLAALASPFLMWSSYMTPRDALIHLRGPRRLAGKEAVLAFQQELAPDLAKAAPDVPLHPQINFTAKHWTTHMFILGAVGGGKSTALEPIFAEAFKRGHKILLFDVKGAFTKKFYDRKNNKGVFLLAPWDKRTIAWDIAADIQTLAAAKAFAEQLIEAGGKDPMWANAARAVLSGFIFKLISERGRNWGWPDLADRLQDFDDLRLLADMKKYNPVAIKSVQEANTTTTGIMINLLAFCDPVFDLATAWAGAYAKPRTLNKISLRRWVLEDDYAFRQIILQGNDSLRPLSHSLNRAVIGFIAAMINDPGTPDSERPLWFGFDEFPQMGKCERLEPILSVGRSRGCRVVIGAQDLGQIVNIYGEKTANNWLSMCGTQIFCRVSAGDTAEWVAKTLGKREVERPNVSTSTGGSGVSVSTGTASVEIPLYHPSELSERLGPFPRLGGVRSVVASKGGGRYELVFPWSPVPEVPGVPSSVLADWLKPAAHASDEEAILDLDFDAGGEAGGKGGAAAALAFFDEQTASAPSDWREEILASSESFEAKRRALLDGALGETAEPSGSGEKMSLKKEEGK